MARRAERIPAIEQETQTAAVQTQDMTEIDLAALGLRLLEKIHWILLTAFAGAVLAGLYVYLLATPIYEATSKIYIVGSETAISLSDLQIGSSLAADYQEVFKNWHVHELVDQKLGLNYSYTKLSGMLSVNNPSGTHVLYIRVKSPDPEEAKLLADAYANVSREFIAAKMDIREPNIFEEARLPLAPVSPQKTRSILIGFLIGLLAAAAVVTARFISDDRICTSEDVSKVGSLPTLGMVPVQNLLSGSAADGSAAGSEKHRGRQGKE